MYWLFDNLFILSKIKFIKKDPKNYIVKAAIFYFISLLCSIIYSIKKIIKIN